MKHATSLVVAAVVTVAVLSAGCGQRAAGPGAGGRAETAVKLRAMVPCGMVGPVSEIIKRFEAANPGVKVDWLPENMVTITRKILDGKEHPDVTLSMGDLEMDLLEDAGLLMAGTRTPIAENSLAIMVPAGNPARVEGVQDLVKPSVKVIAIPDPKENSVGAHAVTALKNAGVWDRIQGKVLLSQFAADSKELAAKGQAEAIIGYYPCAVEVHVPGLPPAKPKNLDLQSQIPAPLYPKFDCEAAVLAAAAQPEAAKSFIEFLRNPESQRTFLEWEFIADVTAVPQG